jgi:hypothetical protein
VGLERGPLSLVSTTEKLLERKISDSGLKNRKYGRIGIFMTHYIYAYSIGVSKRSLQLLKLIEIYSEDMYRVLNCHNIARHTEFYLG